jgi:nucleoside-diphosphate-sugar epimerase
MGFCRGEDGVTHLLAVGLGYSAKAVAERLAAQGWRITGTARAEDGLAAIHAGGYDAVPFAGEAPSEPLRLALGKATHLLLSAPPGAEGDPLLIHHRDDLAAAPALRWIGYLGTIGVYGDHDGAWVDEETSPSPRSDRSRSRLAAEQAWQELGAARDVPVAILRLSGIYGPGRNAFAKLRAGQERRIAKPEQVFNRIHVEDIAAVVEAAIARNAGGIFNVADDEPAPPQDVIAYAAELLGIEPPPLVDWQDADLTPMGRSFYSENKRVRNARLKDVLGIRLRYPTYREGLRALLEAHPQPSSPRKRGPSTPQ